MKHLLVLSVIALSAFTLSTNAQNTNASQVKNSNANPPYKITHNNLSIGNMAYAQQVLLAWKDWDNNTLDNSASLFAEDIVATFPDGSVIKGKENFLKMSRDYRNSLATVVSTVDACTTLKTPDHPDMEVVSIWGTETDTHKDGTTTKTHLNEVWFFNKEGKIYEMHQLAAKEMEEKK